MLASEAITSVPAYPASFDIKDLRIFPFIISF